MSLNFVLNPAAGEAEADMGKAPTDIKTCGAAGNTAYLSIMFSMDRRLA